MNLKKCEIHFDDLLVGSIQRKSYRQVQKEKAERRGQGKEERWNIKRSSSK